MDALLTTIGEGTTKKSNDKAKDTSKKENEVGTISRTEINVPTLVSPLVKLLLPLGLKVLVTKLNKMKWFVS